MGETFHGPLPPIGARVRHYHPWLEDHAVGTVVRYEPVEIDGVGESWWTGEHQFKRFRVHLTDCMHWRSDGSWGPVPDTFFDNLAETWENEADAETGLETVFPTQGTAT